MTDNRVWIKVENTESRPIPPYGVVEIIGVTTDGLFVRVKRPATANIAPGRLLANGPVAIPSDGVGSAHATWPGLALHDSSAGVLALDDTLGTQADSYFLLGGNNGFRALAATTSGQDVAYVAADHGEGTLTVEEEDGSPSYTGIQIVQFDQGDGFSLSQPTAGTVLVNFSGGSGSVTVKEQDGSPSYTGITEIQVNQADGLTLTQPGAGQVLISIADASAIQVGVVSTGTQTFAGNKTFTGTVTGSNSGINVFYGSLAVAPGLMTGANYGGRFHHEFDYGFSCELNSGSLTPAGDWTLETNSGGTELYFTLNDGNASITDVKYRLSVNGTVYTGATATTGGLSFRGGLYTGGTISVSVNSADVAYTPSNTANWNGGVDPGDVNDALDQLAARIKALEP